MSLFCFLLVPLFLSFRHSLGYERGGRKGLTLAFALALAAALLSRAIGDVVPAGLFGFLRWAHLFADRSALPALLPLAAWYALKRFRGAAFDAERTDFILVWLIPVAALRAVTRSAGGDFSDLVLAPLFWIAIAVGVPPLIDAVGKEYGIRAFASAASAVLVPILCVTADWAFFAHLPLIGLLAFAAGVAPSIWETFRAFRAAESAALPDPGEGEDDVRGGT